MIPPAEQRMFSLSLRPYQVGGLILNPLSAAGFYCLSSFDPLSIGVLCLAKFAEFPFLSEQKIREIIKGKEDEVEEWGSLNAILLSAWKTIEGFRYIPEAERRWDKPVYSLLAGDDGKKYLSDYEFKLWLKQG